MSRSAKKILGGIVVTAAVLCAGTLTGCSSEKVEVGRVAEEVADIAESRLSDEELKSVSRQQATSKEESVSIKADASGIPYDIKVSETLAIEDREAMVEDRSTLSDIINPEGDEDYYELEDGSLLWENNGSDITYEGRTDKELPVSVKISYFLDEKECKPEDISGKSGDFKIKIEYENRLSVPFAAITIVPMAKDVFSDVEVSDGKVVNMGDDYMVLGYGAPGLEEKLGLAGCELTEDIELNDSIEITGKCEDFKLDYTSTIFTNGLLRELESDDIKDLKKLSKKSDKLQESTDKLVEGNDKISDGASKLKKYVSEYVKGVSEIRQGTTQIKKAMGTLDENKKGLQDGSKALKDGLSQMNEVLADIDTEKLTLALAADPELAKLGPLLSSLKESTGALYKGAAALDKGVKSYTDGVSEVYKGTKQLETGASSLESAGKELKKGTESLLEGIDKYGNGLKKFDEKGIKKLTKLTGKDYLRVVKNLEELRNADKDYVSFTGDASGKDDSVVFTFETDEV